MAREQPGRGGWLRSRQVGAVLLVACLLSCSSDPGKDLQPESTEEEKLLDWMDLWEDPADVWSRAFYALLEDFTAIEDTAVPTSQIHEWGDSIASAVDELDQGLQDAGLSDFPASPTYSDALRSNVERVRADAAAVQACDATCVDDFEEMFDSGYVLENLVLKTAGVNTTPSAESRTEPIADALLSAAEVGGAPLADEVDPITYLCRPAFEETDALEQREPPAEVVQGAAATEGRLPTFHLVQRWDSAAEASRYFETLDVRAITCPLESADAGDGFVDTWTYQSTVPSSVHTLAWRGRSSDGEKSLYSHGVAALVDDSVVSIVVLSATEQPAQEIGDGLLALTVEGLGVDLTPVTSSGSP